MKRLIITSIFLSLFLFIAILIARQFSKESLLTYGVSILCSIIATSIYDVIGIKSIKKEIKKNTRLEIKDTINDLLSDIETKNELISTTLQNYMKFSAKKNISTHFKLLNNGISVQLSNIKQNITSIKDYFKNGGTDE